jgi:hypothetical protein
MFIPSENWRAFYIIKIAFRHPKNKTGTAWSLFYAKSALTE